jgi:hypothetical protein
MFGVMPAIWSLVILLSAFTLLSSLQVGSKTWSLSKMTKFEK